MIETEVAVEGWPGAADWSSLANSAASAAIAVCGASLPSACEVSIRLTSDAEVHALNRDYRGKDKPTNVLSFPMFAPEEIADLAHSDLPELLLGDIVLAYETCAAEAAEKGVPLEAHASHLIVHGMLHILGYDHKEESAAEEMEALERRAMAAIGLHDPYPPEGD